MKTDSLGANVMEPGSSVPSRQLGRTGIKVSELGFGTWGLGGNSYGPVDDTLSTEVLRCAYDSGVTFYDTSDVYGNGHSEEVLGAALSSVREHIVLATKVGLLPHTTFEMPCDFSDSHIYASVEGSLKRLRTDYIDVYQLHSPTLKMLQRPGLVDTLRKLKQSGKIRAFGVSVRSPADGLIALRNFDFETIQVNFNMIDHRAVESGLFDLALARQVGVIARTPLCFGFLTGKLTGNEVYSGLDHRANWPAAQLKRWAEAPDLFSFINNGKQRTAAQLALRFCLDHPEVSTTIPGMMKCEEVRENLAASALAHLSSEESDLIRSVYHSHSFYDPSAKTMGKPPRS